MRDISVISPVGEKANARVDRDPDSCPVCNHASKPLQTGETMVCVDPSSSEPIKSKAARVLQSAYRCPRQDCACLFIAQYSYNAPSNQGGAGIYKLSRLIPQTAKQAQFDEAIASISPTFIKIFNQAVEAEAHGLDEITGVGLRKALEFLIKDYCIAKDATKAKEIKETFLGNCIKSFVSDTNIKRCAERATWLGNDETHYVRVWDAHDIEDLKRLIKLTVNWIANEIHTDEYFKSMPSKS